MQECRTFLHYWLAIPPLLFVFAIIAASSSFWLVMSCCVVDRKVVPCKMEGEWNKHPYRRGCGAGFVVIVVALLLIWFVESASALRLIDDSRTFSNWTHIADFAFTGGGHVEGFVGSTSGSSWLLLFEESLWVDLRLRKDPEISTCDLKAMASWSVAIEPHGSNGKKVDFLIEEFGKYHAFVVDVNHQDCSQTMQVLIKWRKTKSRGPVRIFHRLFSNRFHHWHNTAKKNDMPVLVRPANGLTTIQFDLHFENRPYGRFREFSAEEMPILPTLSVFVILYVFLVRFQIASTRLLWTNSGVAIASALLVIFAAKLASICITFFGLIIFMFRGKELSASHDYKWGSMLLDGIYGVGTTLLLVFTAKGWMIATPSVSLRSDKSLVVLLIAFVIHTFANVFSVAELIFFDATSVTLASDHYGMAVEILVGCSHFYMFVSTYADLVNVMLRSRKFPGARIRGRAFSVVAVLLMTWGVLPILQIAVSHILPFWLEPFAVTLITLSIQLFMGTLFAWAFRPEMLWELHGERPHRGAARLLTGKPVHGPSSDDNIGDELDGLLL